ncbi:DHA2 family efflux MFS transporter permease subunit [Thermomonas hydrothermalis]|uniref:MFS transporter, DHA2 family, multidrug resistance protein n=1 Tax=Thermomonas hydrothermalis TaxID=213588 RepID=A0A1M4WMZ7_9GAMM|nr:DHA2 family efflux MFS transporter permease subunit [Thermomonas hydrothermalis]SHE82606.1 MFS transporter, DHA2 family, multidrug resistance protein [Thermomonas hydrothermalis]
MATPAADAAPAAAASPKPPLTGGALALLTLAIALSTFMEVLDITIVNVSVPTIAGSLSVGVSEGTWAISSYSLASAIVQPLTGWLARRFGEVRTFTASVTLFVVFSVLCGFATSMPMLVVARLLQGLVSGPMVALSMTLLLANYPQEKKGMALALWAMTVIVAPIFGPILGGWITDNYSWHWIFFINAPVGLLAALVVWTLLRDRETPIRKVPIDRVGLALLVIGVGALQFMLDNGNDKDWFNSPLITTLFIIAIVCLTFFVAWELTDDHPVVDLTLFRQRNFRVGVIALSIGMFGFFGINVVYPLWLQTTLGYTAEWAGLATAPVGILAVLFSPLVGRLIARADLRIMVSFAFLVFAFTTHWFSTFTAQASFDQLIWPRLLQGLGVAFFFIPLNQIILSGLPPSEIASASGLSNFFRTIAGSISTAVSVTLWQHRADYHHAVLAESVNAARPAAEHWLGTLQGSGLASGQALAVTDQTINLQAFTLAVNDVFMLFSAMFVAMIVLVWWARPPFGSTGGAAAH